VDRRIAARTFERSFRLADYLNVKGANRRNGLLQVNLVSKIPEAVKPPFIPIASCSKLLEVKPAGVAA
jgi:molecular chaperone IbpA